MKRFLLLGIILLLPRLCLSQTSKQENDSLLKTVISLKEKLLQTQGELIKTGKRLNSIEYDYKNKLIFVNNKLDSLSTRVKINTDNILSTQVKFENQTQEIRVQSSSGINKLSQNISRSSIFWAICFFIAVILSIIIYILLKKSIRLSGIKLTDEIQVTRKKLEEEGIKLDNKLLELLDKQLDVKNQEKVLTKASGELDHSLAIKVADEIIRIQKNLSQMDDSVKGIKQLSASVERIRSNFEANGYEIVDMLNKVYNDGMKVQANFRPDDNLKEGEQIITRVIKPQVNYKGIMIQSAQIEVSQG
jgi:hypothetical protein